MKKIILTFDLEYWFESLSIQRYINKLEKDSISLFINRILILLKNNGATATFFVTGKILEKEPDIVKKISTHGHEIAIHSLDHRPLWQKNARQFDDELKFISKKILELTGNRPQSHRAVNFSLNQSTAWALKIMSNNGIRFDSSIFPFVMPRIITKIFKDNYYGIKSKHYNPYWINYNQIDKNNNDSVIMEFPLSVFHFSMFHLPVTGGIYIRFIPWMIFKILAQKKLQREPACFHFHPFDFANQPPAIKMPMIKKTIKYFNTKNTWKKLEYFVKKYSCISIENYAKKNPLN